jgi:hypothetical protein
LVKSPILRSAPELSPVYAADELVESDEAEDSSSPWQLTLEKRVDDDALYTFSNQAS